MAKKYIFIYFMTLVVNLYILPYSSVEAKRDAENVEQKTFSVPRDAKMQGETKKVKNKKGTLKERIKNILHPIKEKEQNKIDEKKENKDSLIRLEIMTAKSILGTPIATEEQCVKHLLKFNKTPHINVEPALLVHYYYEEGMKEGIRPDVAFAQALKETGYFRYGGTVVPEQNNYCGLGTTSKEVKGAYFATPKLGVRAHIQHLLAYTSLRHPKEKIIDPRYELVRSTYRDKIFINWSDLNGRWAVPGDFYGESILMIFERILEE